MQLPSGTGGRLLHLQSEDLPRRGERDPLIMSYEIKQNEMNEACDTFGREERCLQSFFWGGGSERKRIFGRPRLRCKDNIRMDLHEINGSKS